MSIIYFFIDGIGLGEPDPEVNPFYRYSESFFATLGSKEPSRDLPEDFFMRPTDAHMGYPGLPQSATGQTSLWTGINGVSSMGRHMTGFPGPTLIQVIQRQSIIKRVVDAGLKATLLNAYSDDYTRRIQRRPRMISASTHVQWASGQELKTFADLENKDALFMDITHEFMHQFMPLYKDRFPQITAYEQGQNLVKISRNYDLVLYEYFLTDKAGHNQDFEQTRGLIKTLEDFLDGITAEMDQNNELLIISSDHGNAENLSVKTHTNNKVPTFSYGKGARQIYESVNSLMDIPALIYKILGVEIDLESERLSEETVATEKRAADEAAEVAKAAAKAAKSG